MILLKCKRGKSIPEEGKIWSKNNKTLGTHVQAEASACPEEEETHGHLGK
jgi:hypothetical protein